MCYGWIAVSISPYLLYNVIIGGTPPSYLNHQDSKCQSVLMLQALDKN